MTRLIVLFSIIALLVPGLPSAQAASTLLEAPASDQLTRASVIRVVDGDTVHVDLDGEDDTIRLIGIDTPETVDPRGPVACFGQEASAFTKAVLAPGTAVWLERDVSDTDRYQRLLRYVWIEYNSSDQRFSDVVGLDTVEDGELVLFNQLLVSQGYAASSAYPPDVEYQSTFIEDQRVAREESRGLWGSCSAFGVPAGGSGQSDPQPTSAPTSGTTSGSGAVAGSCDPSYPDACIPPISDSGDLDCGDVAERRFQVLPPDPHGFDRDLDGIGCES